jgi:hypothetical protein
MDMAVTRGTCILDQLTRQWSEDTCNLAYPPRDLQEALWNIIKEGG